MAETGDLVAHWEIPDAYRTKGLIKYEIKKNEGLLNLLLSLSSNETKANEITQLCNVITCLYENYLEQIDLQVKKINKQIICYLSWQECYQQIRIIQHRIMSRSNLGEEHCLILHLCNLYKALPQLVQKDNLSQASFAKDKNNNLEDLFNFLESN
ncbi:Uncharacterised protein (plasmid) [Legionella adelaidensis]|uniref:Uncharacterized protein n=1 Tax=Legionella adelaidensis TaxID=45056 RepID=A0A0W0R2F0_9GAMM|nr:hypothetical protein [Legionella adelaidensis]KTC65283.1 hypothetical protein Lade_1466 [Legionella adelaidensis]VEH81227.1 Uncharacterised protein [Legionella adelaidensis]